MERRCTIAKMKQKIYKLIVKSGLSGFFLFPYRIKLVLGYQKNLFPQIFGWLKNSKEITNFTYDLTDVNKGHLVAMVSTITKMEVDQVEKYLKEIIKDRKLKGYITKMTRNSDFKHVSDEIPAFGRRIGWYMLVRATKPKVVVETGVDKGLGSCLIAAALMKNKEEGSTGYYYGTDINPDAGFLFDESYAEYGEILYGDSIKSLKNLNTKIDMFISDSVHTYEYEKKEYQTVKDKLKANSVVIADNAHNNEALLKFAKMTKRKFLFFKEQPKNHWYPGGGMGVAFK